MKQYISVLNRKKKMSMTLVLRVQKFTIHVVITVFTKVLGETGPYKQYKPRSDAAECGI